MSDDHEPTHVLSSQAVRWSIDQLGAQKLHPTFVMYLYLRREHRAGQLAEASASSSEVLSLIDMPGHPTKPYYFPLIDRGVRSGSPLPSFWRARNIPGSWSPGSIHRLKGGSWMGLPAGGYAMPSDHVELALRELLYGSRVSALALGCYFLRNDGFTISGNPTPGDIIDGFKLKFDFKSQGAEGEFAQLFSADVPSTVDFLWFEPFTPPTFVVESAGNHA